MFVGHDYAIDNLEFALDLEPGNKSAQKKLEEVETAISENIETPPSTIGEEKSYNPFMRYDVEEVVEEVKKRVPDLDTNDPGAIFKAIRELRNEWTS